MSAAAATSTFRTVIPLMSIPRMAPAIISAWSGKPASLTPPALPRPPTRTWALITTCGAPAAKKRSAANRASSTVWATSQSGTGSPWATSNDLASASWIFTRGTLQRGAKCGDAMVPRQRPINQEREGWAAPGLSPRLQSGHVPPRDADPRRRHRSGAGGGDLSRPRRDRDRLRMGGSPGRRGDDQDTGDATPGGGPRIRPTDKGGTQGTDHHAGRRRLPQCQRRAPSGARVVRQPAAGSLDEGARQPVRGRRPGHRP